VIKILLELVKPEVAMFIYLGTTVTNQYFFHEKIKSRLIQGCLLSFSSESFVSPSLPSLPLSLSLKEVKIKIYKIII
jgi:hypothetical protein